MHKVYLGSWASQVRKQSGALFPTNPRRNEADAISIQKIYKMIEVSVIPRANERIQTSLLWCGYVWMIVLY